MERIISTNASEPWGTWERFFVPYADCCDGTDEAPGKCSNTCDEAGAENRANLKRKASNYGTGLKLKRKYISQAGTQRKKWEQELSDSKRKEIELQRQVDKLRGETRVLN